MELILSKPHLKRERERDRTARDCIPFSWWFLQHFFPYYFIHPYSFWQELSFLDFDAIGSSCRSPSWQASLYFGFHLPVVPNTCVDACCFCFHKQNSTIPQESIFFAFDETSWIRWAPKIRCNCLELFVPPRNWQEIEMQAFYFLCDPGPQNRSTLMLK